MYVFIYLSLYNFKIIIDVSSEKSNQSISGSKVENWQIALLQKN